MAYLLHRWSPKNAIIFALWQIQIFLNISSRFIPIFLPFFKSLVIVQTSHEKYLQSNEKIMSLVKKLHSQKEALYAVVNLEIVEFQVFL